MIRRARIIDNLRKLLDDEAVRHIAIIGEDSIGKSTLMRSLAEDGFFGEEKKEYIYIYHTHGEALSSIDIPTTGLVIVDTDNTYASSDWIDFYESIGSDVRSIVLSRESFSREDVYEIVLTGVSFREYAESQGYTIDISAILQGNYDRDKMAEIMDVYLHHGAYPKHLTHPESLEEDFRNKWSLIELEVFEKEKQGLLDFARALAMNVGNPFKADQIAKMLDISRRKVNKYTELLMLHKVIEAIGPWGEHPETETTRHVKIYFSDLGYMHALLGDIHGEGTLRAGAIENFIYLELERKLDETHKIAYYRKKSGADITFILEDESTEKVTPIFVSPRDSKTIPKIFESFDMDYHDRVERYMVVDHSLSSRSDYAGLLFLVIPHIAI